MPKPGYKKAKTPEESRLKRKVWLREWKEKNREKLREQDRVLRAKNREHINEGKRRRYAENPEVHRNRVKSYAKRNPEKIRERFRDWSIKNKAHRMAWVRAYTKTQKFRDYGKRRYDSDLNFKVRTVLRSRLYMAIKGRCKSASTVTLLGCDIPTLIAHIQSQFKEGMTWENFGEWHMDHIKPCAKFNLVDPEQQKLCFHFTNLQPLWADENRKKRDKFTDALPASSPT